MLSHCGWKFSVTVVSQSNLVSILVHDEAINARASSQQRVFEQVKLLSLFAGGGGLDAGLEQAGFRTVLANELEEHGCRTLEENRALSHLKPEEFNVWFDKQLQQRCYRAVSEAEKLRLYNRLKLGVGQERHFLEEAHILQGDIRGYPSETLAELAHMKTGELDLVAGGPPCQPFSRSGKRQTFDVSDGQLFLEFVRIARDLKPRWFLFENVKGLILNKTAVVSQTCGGCGKTRLPSFEDRNRVLQDELSSLPCPCSEVDTPISVENVRGGTLTVILNEFERIGYRCTWKVLNAADFGAPQARERLIVIGSRDNEEFYWPEPTHTAVNVKTTAQQSLFGQTPALKPWVTMKESVWKEGHSEFGSLDSEEAVLWVKNVVRPHDEPVTWRLDRPSPTVGAHQAAKLAIAPEGVPETQLARQQWHVLGKRQGDTSPVPVKHALLSDEELLALQTFPRNWYLYGTRMQRAFQIGNAVPPTLAKALGEAIFASSNASSKVLQYT